MRGMKVKTSVSLSEELLEEIDREPKASRSEYIERVLKQHFRLKRREERGQRDAAIYARMSADELREAEEWLAVQPDLAEFGDDAQDLIEAENERAAG